MSTFTPAPPRWNSPCRGEGAYPLRSSNQSASTSGARRSDAATCDKDKQIFLSTLLRTGFNTEVCSYLAFHSYIETPLVSADAKGRSAHDVVRPKSAPDNGE